MSQANVNRTHSYKNSDVWVLGFELTRWQFSNVFSTISVFQSQFTFNSGCTECRTTAAALPRRYCVVAASLPFRCPVDSWDPHGFPKGLLIMVVVFVYIICQISENAINRSEKKNRARHFHGSSAAAAWHPLHIAQHYSVIIYHLYSSYFILINCW